MEPGAALVRRASLRPPLFRGRLQSSDIIFFFLIQINNVPKKIQVISRKKLILKLIKTYQWSTMDEERLSSLAILSVENYIAESFQWTTFVNEIAKIKAQKVPLNLRRPYKLK